MTHRSSEDFATSISAFRREMWGRIRRFSISATGDTLWQLLGHFLLDVSVREGAQAEVYPGIGFFSRPPDGSGSAEAIVVNVGGVNNPAVIATRDEATRQAAVGDLAPDEAALYNTVSRVHALASGLIEARTHAGTAAFLALLSELQGIKAVFQNWVPVAGDGGAALKAEFAKLIAGVAPYGPATWPQGTKKLKGE